MEKILTQLRDTLHDLGQVIDTKHFGQSSSRIHQAYSDVENAILEIEKYHGQLPENLPRRAA